ncbi:MAG: sensor histidine kinase [Burkholderiaceae bacterium]
MNFAALHRLSLRRTLMLVLFPGLMLVVGAELWLTWRASTDAANAAYDRSLLGAIKSIDANISTASGGLGVELPYVMLEFFQLTANGQVFYRVATEGGLVEIGSPDLPQPPKALVTGQPQFSDATYFGEPVRVGSYARLLDHPIAGRASVQRVIIQVAETLESRQDFTRGLVLRAVARDLILVAAATALLVLAVAWALRPLARLRNAVAARSAKDLTPISATDIPADVQPLVDAINQHVERNRLQAEAQRRFLDDASHQLRTPLATLTTQIGFALRETDPASARLAMTAIKSQLDETVRQINQMLALARGESVWIEPESVDVNELAHEVTRKWWSEARNRGVDLGLERPDEALLVLAQPGLLTEALSNLLHNALRYTPRGGQVTVLASGQGEQVSIAVIDNGPGIPESEIGRAGERFFRGSNVKQPGTGLGLAIVQSIIERMGGTLQLAPGPKGRGLAATLSLPRAAPASRD